ncbi:esterase/lipase family protein [Streptomyces sp. NPDC057757]|uniref:esterase/lipase family protein n=1 Tax=Streptomyces sp. NPDC057757 TaxID=3346241 RepID=UPI0036BA4D6D
MSKPQRRILLFLSVFLAAVLTALTTATPANAAPPRSTTNTNTVIFVHGIQGNPLKTGHDCTASWADARRHFKDKGWRGNLRTFGYYRGDTRCSHEYGGNRDTPINTVAKAFANYVYDNFSKPSKGSKKIDVVAHSMGGLVVRAALYHTRRGTAGFPPYLYIEDVATLATPHGGSTNDGFCRFLWRQCKDMRPGSAFLDALPTTMPNSRMGTDWTTMSSFHDGYVSESSGIAGTAEHEIQYNDSRVGHVSFPKLATGTYNARIKNNSTWTGWGRRAAPAEMARIAVYGPSTG